MTYLMALLGFAFVIFIHELGHFVFAKWAGVRVDTFSIGMGPVIWSKTIGETEYAISLLPVGGYVKMLGQEDVPGRAVDAENERSFQRKHPAWRAAILFGGVLFNLISSYLILVALAWTGVPVFPPVVGELQQHFLSDDGSRIETPAWRLGLQQGDRILSINDQPVRSYQDLLMRALGADTGTPIHMTIERDGQQLQLPQGQQEAIKLVYDPTLGRPDLGIRRPQGLRILTSRSLSGEGTPDTAPQPGERLVGLVETDSNFAESDLLGQQVMDRLAPFVGEEIGLRLASANGKTERTLRIRYAGDLVGGTDLVAAGIGLPVVVERVIADLPAARAGILPGDILYQVDGDVVRSGAHFKGLLRRALEQEDQIRLTVLRQSAADWQPHEFQLSAVFDERLGQMIIGIGMSALHGGQLPVLPPALGHEQSPLAVAGLQPGDAILRIDYDPVTPSTARVAHVPAATQELLPLDERQWFQLHKTEQPIMPVRLVQKIFGLDPIPSVFAALAGSRIAQPLQPGGTGLVVEQLDETGRLSSHRIDVQHLAADTRSLLQRLQAGDWVAEARGTTVDGESALIVLRSAEAPQWLRIALADPGVALALLPAEVPYHMQSWTEAFSYANEQTEQMITTTLTLIPRFFQRAEEGGIDASKSLQGPIGIFNELSTRFEYLGFASFLKLVALIGLNLFLINLLPIPIVDGGQLLFLAIETIIRRPVPVRVQEAFNWLGFALVVTLMLYVIGNDIVNRL